MFISFNLKPKNILNILNYKTNKFIIENLWNSE